MSEHFHTVETAKGPVRFVRTGEPIVEVRAVHILNHDGTPLFNRLFDDGSMVFTFESGSGFVDRLDVERFGWTIVPGWTSWEEESIPA